MFIDPVTATAVGELTVYGSSSALPVRTWISELHRHLHLGEPGRLYSELAASWLWVIALGGLFLWIDRYRRGRRRDRGTPSLLTVDRRSTGRARTLNWHGVAGIWIAVGLIFLSATGLTWSTYAGENVTDLRTALDWTTPAVTTTIGSGSDTATGDHAAHGHSATRAPTANGVADTGVNRIDTVLEKAREVGITGAVQVSVPAMSDTAFLVAETRQPWVMSNNSVSIDGATGDVVAISWFADWPLAAKLSAWGIQLHMGTLFGLANQLALLAQAIALVSVVVRGYLMWWKRRPSRETGLPFGRPPARGGLRRLPPAGVIAGGIVAVAVGWFTPLLGVSLLAFLVIDVAINFRRTPPTSPVAAVAAARPARKATS